MLDLGEDIFYSDGFEAQVAVHPAAIDAWVKGAYTLLHGALTIVPWREPIGFAGTEDGDDRLAQRGGEVGGEGIVTKHSVGTLQGGNERGKIGRV